MPNPSTYFAGRFSSLAAKACIIDTSLPTFAGISAVAFQNDGSALLSWSAATTTKPPITYQLFVALGSVSAGSLFVTANMVDEVPAAMASWRVFMLANQTLYFNPGSVYTFGVRAVDSFNYSDTNTAILTATASNVSYNTLASAVWDQPKSAHTTSGTFGFLLDAQVSLTQLASTALTQYNALTTAIGLTQTAATALTQYNNIQTAIAATQTAATALTQFNSIITAIGTPQQASVALTQYTNLQTTIAAVQQASTALTQYNALTTAIGLTQTVATALTQYNNLQTVLALLQTAATALSQFNILVSDIGSITPPNNAGIAAIKAQTDQMLFDGSSFIKANAEVTIDDPNIAAIKAQTDKLQFDGSNNVKANAELVTGQVEVKKNQALNAFEFLMTDIIDHDPAPGLTVTVTRSIDGGAFAACANSVVEVGQGIYSINLAATDLNGNVITLRFAAVGGDTRFITIVTQA